MKNEFKGTLLAVGDNAPMVIEGRIFLEEGQHNVVSLREFKKITKEPIVYIVPNIDAMDIWVRRFYPESTGKFCAFTKPVVAVLSASEFGILSHGAIVTREIVGVAQTDNGFLDHLIVGYKFEANELHQMKNGDLVRVERVDSQLIITKINK